MFSWKIFFEVAIKQIHCRVSEIGKILREGEGRERGMNLEGKETKSNKNKFEKKCKF